MGRAANLAAESAAERKGFRSLCSFRVGDALYGVAIAAVCEILGSIDPWPVPLAPAFIGGLVHYRGEVLTTVSLRTLFQLPPSPAAGSVLVIDGPNGRYGLLVDSVVEVVEADPDAFENCPSTLRADFRSLLTGVCKLAHTLLIEIDPALLDPLLLAAQATHACFAPANANTSRDASFARGSFCPLPAQAAAAACGPPTGA